MVGCSSGGAANMVRLRDVFVMVGPCSCCKGRLATGAWDPTTTLLDSCRSGTKPNHVPNDHVGSCDQDNVNIWLGMIPITRGRGRKCRDYKLHFRSKFHLLSTEALFV